MAASEGVEWDIAVRAGVQEEEGILSSSGGKANESRKSGRPLAVAERV